MPDKPMHAGVIAQLDYFQELLNKAVNLFDGQTNWESHHVRTKLSEANFWASQALFIKQETDEKIIADKLAASKNNFTEQ